MGKAEKNFLHSGRAFCAIGLLAMILTASPEVSLAAEPKGRFSEYEIRVIRPRYFQKAQRFELGAQGTAIMNDTFVYSFLFTAIMGYHFSEALAFEFAGSGGFSVDREEKRTLFDEFQIYTQIFRTLFSAEGSLQYTPMYGKWQLPSGKLIYFDTYISAGGGITGIDWQYSDFCVADKDPTTQQELPVPTNRVATYPTIAVGLGQRYFIEKDLALKWDLRNHSMFYSVADTSCDPETTETGSSIHHNLTLQFGASKFF